MPLPRTPSAVFAAVFAHWRRSSGSRGPVPLRCIVASSPNRQALRARPSPRCSVGARCRCEPHAATELELRAGNQLARPEKQHPQDSLRQTYGRSSFRQNAAARMVSAAPEHFLSSSYLQALATAERAGSLPSHACNLESDDSDHTIFDQTQCNWRRSSLQPRRVHAFSREPLVASGSSAPAHRRAWGRGCA